MLMQELAKRLTDTRKLAEDLSSRELGSLAGLAETYPSLIESQQRKQVGADVVAKMAAVLGVSTDYLILGTGEVPTAETVKAAVAIARASKLASEADTEKVPA
jgi:transcriptional regulator with XRE-family HTH domain